MKIHTLVLGVLDTNTYIVEADDALIVVDPADEPDKILAKASEIGKPIGCVLLTHGHFDHCNAAKRLQTCGAKVLMSKTDYEMIENGLDLAEFCDVKFNKFVPDEFIGEGQIELCGVKIDVLATPGHTAGSLTYVMGDNIFSGDVIFYLGVGRTDLPTGDGNAIIRSLKKLFSLDGVVYTGHGRATTMKFEREHSVYVKSNE